MFHRYVRKTLSNIQCSCLYKREVHNEDSRQIDPYSSLKEKFRVNQSISLFVEVVECFWVVIRTTIFGAKQTTFANWQLM